MEVQLLLKKLKTSLTHLHHFGGSDNLASPSWLWFSTTTSGLDDSERRVRAWFPMESVFLFSPVSPFWTLRRLQLQIPLWWIRVGEPGLPSVTLQKGCEKSIEKDWIGEIDLEYFSFFLFFESSDSLLRMKQQSLHPSRIGGTDWLSRFCPKQKEPRFMIELLSKVMMLGNWQDCKARVHFP